MTRTTLLRLSGVKILLVVTGCVSWQPAAVGPEAAIRSEQPERVRITRDDGMQAIVAEPRVEDDQIVGRVEACVLGSASAAACGPTIVPVVALDRVRLLEVERPDRAKTLTALTLSATVGLIVAAVLWAGQACADGATFYC